MRFPLRYFPATPRFNFMRYRHAAFILSFVVLAATVTGVFTRGLNFGIDFTGGVLIEARTAQDEDLGAMRHALAGVDVGSVALQSVGSGRDVLIRLQGRQGQDYSATAELVKKTLVTVAPGIEFRQVEVVGPQVGRELIQSGALALGLAFLAIMLYIWFRFEWQFGVGGIAALFHDAVATVGFFVVTQLEFDLTSVAVVLTIVGYSINDSVVIYDRIRENLRKYKKMPMDELINLSLNETLSRTVLTAGTVFIATGSLILFGGEVLKSFSWAMLFGVVAGTYSSIFISAPILIYFHLRDIGTGGEKALEQGKAA